MCPDSCTQCLQFAGIVENRYDLLYWLRAMKLVEGATPVTNMPWFPHMGFIVHRGYWKQILFGLLIGVLWTKSGCNTRNQQPLIPRYWVRSSQRLLKTDIIYSIDWHAMNPKEGTTPVTNNLLFQHIGFIVHKHYWKQIIIFSIDRCPMNPKDGVIPITNKPWFTDIGFAVDRSCWKQISLTALIGEWLTQKRALPI